MPCRGDVVRKFLPVFYPNGALGGDSLLCEQWQNASYIHEMLLPNPSPYSPALSYTLLYVVIIQTGEGGEGFGDKLSCI